MTSAPGQDSIGNHEDLLQYTVLCLSYSPLQNRLHLLYKQRFLKTLSYKQPLTRSSQSLRTMHKTFSVGYSAESSSLTLTCQRWIITGSSVHSARKRSKLTSLNFVSTFQGFKQGLPENPTTE